MGKRGQGYGSEDNLLRYREHRPDFFDNALRRSLKAPDGLVEWVYPLRDLGKEEYPEPEGLEFVQDEKVLALWREFWPQKGKQPTWDGVAKLTHQSRTEWILIEAKANRPELCSSPCGAKGGRRQISKAMGKVKEFLNVHRRFSWLGTYYQYANRLACLYFLTQVAGVPARLVFLYFYGDSFGDGTPCPGSEAEWRAPIDACHLTLGLAERHLLSNSVAEVFLPALAKQGSG